MRALASHRCVPGSIPGPGVISGLSLLLVHVPAPRAFFSRFQRFSSLHKNQQSKFQFDLGMRATGLSASLLVLPSLNKVNLLIFSAPRGNFRYVCHHKSQNRGRIQPKTIDLRMRPWGITTEFEGFIFQSLVLRSVGLG